MEKGFWKQLLANKMAITGLIILTLMVITAILAPLLAPSNPIEQDLSLRLERPTFQNLMGRDSLGRDIFSRLIYGSRVSVTVGILVVGISGLIGCLVGAISGYYGGFVDQILMRLVDLLLAFPGIILAIALVAVLGPDLFNVILALCLTGWVGYARLVRGQILSLKEQEFVLAAQALGAGPGRVIFVHLLPNCLAVIMVKATLGMAIAITAEAGLSFLGLGTPPPTPSWGSMLNEGIAYLTVAPHLTIFPGAAIMAAVLGLNFLGDALRDILDPRMSG